MKNKKVIKHVLVYSAIFVMTFSVFAGLIAAVI